MLMYFLSANLGNIHVDVYSVYKYDVIKFDIC